MKIFTKKSVIIAALAVVLLTTALVISCNSPFDEGGISDKEEPSKPGTGKVRLTINPRKASRTILPSDLHDDTRYLLILTGSGGVSTHYEDVTSAAGTGSAETISDIPVGTYASAKVVVYVRATAFDSSTDTYNATFFNNFVIGESTVNDGPGSAGFAVNSGSTVSLGSYSPVLFLPGAYGSGTSAGAGTGTFSYKIKDSTTSSLFSSGRFIVNKIGGGNLNGGSPYTITANDTETPVLVSLPGGSPNIPTGYYDVIFTLTDKTNQKVTFFETLHVYKNNKSLFELDITNTLLAAAVPSVGDTEIEIVVPGYSNVVGSLTTNDTTNVDITMGYPNVVDITLGANRKLTFRVSSPTGGDVTYVGWVLGDTSAILTDGTKGITIDNSVTDDFTIIFDTTHLSFPYPKDGTYIVIQLKLLLDSTPFNVPIINVSFN